MSQESAKEDDISSPLDIDVGSVASTLKSSASTTAEINAGQKNVHARLIQANIINYKSSGIFLLWIFPLLLLNNVKNSIQIAKDWNMSHPRLKSNSQVRLNLILKLSYNTK